MRGSLSTSVATTLSLVVLGASQPVKSDDEEVRTVTLTTPSIGSQHTVSNNAAIAEGFVAEIVQHDDAVRMLEDKTLRFDRRNEFTLAAGTVLLAERGRWFCTYGPPRRVAQRFNIHICLRDRDRDGLFDQSRIQGSTRSSPMKPKVPYEELESWIEYVPADGLKRVLIFSGYEAGTLRLTDIEFEETPNDSASTREVTVPLPNGTGDIEVGGIGFRILSANSNTISFVRTSGELRPSPQN